MLLLRSESAPLQEVAIMDIVFHYPPELSQLLVDTIPLLCPRKRDVLSFFQGAGVSSSVTADLETALRSTPGSVNKFEMTRAVLTRLNERGEATLRERREVLRRVVEFEDYSTCWPTDQLKAKGLVAEIRRVINVKDAFTRIDIEREKERRKRLEEHQATERARLTRLALLRGVHKTLLGLFTEDDPQRRGKLLEGVLNQLFKESGVLVTEAFTLRGAEGEGVVEQIDGVIDFEGQHYLVEMKWWREALGVGEVSSHLVRVFSRGHARGIIISASDYTAPAIAVCRDSLKQSVIVLARLQEIVLLLEREVDLKAWLKEKINAAIAFKRPLHESALLS